MVSEELKPIVDSQFIKWLGNQHVKAVEDIDFIIKPTEYKYIPNYMINLVIKYEKRNFLFNQIKPYKGEKLPKTVAPLREIWDYKIETSDEMQKSEDSFTINESFEKETCPTCKGDSSSDCPKCDGVGKVDCKNCNGYGELICGKCDGDKEIWCPDCDGKGRKKCSSCNGSGNRIVNENGKETSRPCRYCNGKGSYCCERCNGTKKVLCPTCDGKGSVICKKCNGNRTFKCEECNGEGTIYCSTCQGASDVLKYTEIKRENDILKKMGFFFNSETPDGLKKLIETKLDFVDFEKETVSYATKELDSFIKSQDEGIQPLLKDLIEGSNKEIPEGTKIAKIEFSILICKTYLLTFSCLNENYKYYSYNDKHFFEQESVLHKIRSELNLYYYKKLYDEKNYVDAFVLLEEICKTKKSEKAKDRDLYKQKKKELKKNDEYKKQLKERKLAQRKEIREEKKVQSKELKEKNLSVQQQVKEKELAGASKKSRTVALVLCIFFGWLGVHRYYTGNGLTGFLQFLLSLCFGIGVIWAFVDLILIAVGAFKDKEKKYVLRW